MKKIPVRQLKATTFNNAVGRFHIRTLELVLNGQDLVHDLHRHDFFFILVVKKGKGTHWIDFEKLNIKDRSIFILRPGQVHQLTLAAGSTGFLLEFDSQFYQPVHKEMLNRLRKATYKNYCELEAGRFEKILQCLSGIYEENQQRQDGYQEIIRASLDIFFVEYNRQSDKPSYLRKTVVNYNQDRFEELMDLLQQHISEKKQPADYATLMNLSLYQLNAITKSAVGKPVSILVNEQIILEAKRLLMATNNQVKEIADQLGYEDISYFIRYFRKHTGLTPEAYRQKLA